MKKNNLCKVCSSKTNILFSIKVLNKYSVNYQKCQNCGLIQTEKPYWLKEAYSSAIIDSDTGVLSRNIILSKIASIMILLFSGNKSKVLDYAGGYGIMTRMLRDIGIDCYWKDKFAQNIFAKGFEDKNQSKYDVVTAFELFEHFENPNDEVKNIFNNYEPKMLLFSTTLHNGNPPKKWWYFAPQGGQHITLYTKKSLQILADRFGLKLSTNGRNIHIFSKKIVPEILMKLVSVSWPLLSKFTLLFYKSKIFDDHSHIALNK